MGMNTISAGRQSTPAPVSRTEVVNPGDAVRLDELMRAQEKPSRRKKTAAGRLRKVQGYFVIRSFELM
jgi:hypothetical protein